MGKRIAIIQGHPDPRGNHFGHALAEAYAVGAEAAKHEVRFIHVATLDFPLLRCKEDFEQLAPPEAIRQAQETIRWAHHLVIVFPLWQGMMPALLKAFLEQVLRPGFATSRIGPGNRWARHLAGKTAHVVVTMGMSALVYRSYFGAHGVKSQENILKSCGIRPIRRSLIGMVEASPARREKWLEKMTQCGRKGR